MKNRAVALAFIVSLLLSTPAAVRWVSLEPLLGSIELDCGASTGGPNRFLSVEVDHEEDAMLDWVVVGGESGPGARPMHQDWARSIRDECQKAGVPFFFKQFGEWAPFIDNGPIPVHLQSWLKHVSMRGEIRLGDAEDGDECMGRVGKKQAGRLLDGQEWSEFPNE